MLLDDFSREIARAKRNGEALDADVVASCLSDLSKAAAALDSALDELVQFVPKGMKAEIEEAGNGAAFDFFTPSRLLKMMAATMLGVGAASDPDAKCPFDRWQREEAKHWREAYEKGRALIEGVV